ncbi:MAG: asparagine--tRNA ligase [Pseudomonadales bacterium]|nr:asparagine--tRNA ligase [Pseudomonadales bacterium]
MGELVTVQGWLRSRRTSRAGLTFLSVHDGSVFSTIQVVVKDNLENYEVVVDLGTGCALEVCGMLVESQGKGQDREIQATSVTVVGRVSEPDAYPIAKKRHSFEFLRTVAHLRPRTNTFGAVARLRQAAAKSIHDFFHQQGFLWVNTPIITASDCEGAGDLFRVSTLDAIHQGHKDDFFGTETFLTVSGQLNVEAFCLALSKVYTFGPTFRAENSNTSRHLAEFWMIEPEIAFADLEANADLAERFLKFVAKQTLELVPDDMAFFAERIDSQAITRLEKLVESDFTRMEYSEAVQTLQRSGRKFEYPVEWGLDLQSEHERFLCEEMWDAPGIVMNYPKDIKAFYMRSNDDGKTVAAMDVLVPGVGEIIGGSQREERLHVLDSRMDVEMQQELWWYRDLRKFGTVPHAGFGLGFERLLQYFSGMDNIRDVIPFPRVPRNAAF